MSCSTKLVKEFVEKAKVRGHIIPARPRFETGFPPVPRGYINKDVDPKKLREELHDIKGWKV